MNVKKVAFYSIVISIFYLGSPCKAQNNSASSKTDVEYELLYDEPYDLNKMWVHFIPLYADFFSTNFNAGFGLQANYYLKNKFDFRLLYRMPYSQGTDNFKHIGEKEKTNTAHLSGFKLFEIGGTYHIKDESSPGTSRMVVYTKRYSDEKWAATVPDIILIPSKVRKIIGARLGGYFWSSTTNIGSISDKQNVPLIALTTPDTLDVSNLTGKKYYGSLSSAGVYLGGSLATIRNVAIKPKKYDGQANDVMFTLYADILYAPMVKVNNISTLVVNNSTNTKTTFDASKISVQHLGFRAGFEGMTNKEFGWSYGGEVGYRPSISGRGFYVTAKIAFTFATRFDQKRQAVQITKPSE